MTRSSAVKDMAEVEGYAAAVREHLADVPPAEREELLEDLEQHLLEVAAEEGAGLEARLGRPGAYAAELRASAGLEPAGRKAAAGLRARLAAPEAMQRLTALAEELRPGWWIARAYLVVLVLGAATDPWAPSAFPYPSIFGHPLLGLVVLAIAVYLSVRIGRKARASTGWRLTSAGFSLLAVVAILAAPALARQAYHERLERAVAVRAQPAGALHAPDGGPITNIYAYDRGGRPLEQVLLYDQDGHPIEILLERTPDGRPVVTSFPLDERGVPVTNAYPQRQAVRSPRDREVTEGRFGTPPSPDVPVLEERATGPAAPTAAPDVVIPPSP